MMSRKDGSNTTGKFQVRFQQTIMYFIVSDKGNQIPYPQLDKKWEEGVLADAKNVFNIQSTRSSANDRVLPGESRNKRQRMAADVDPYPLTIDANHLESHGPVLSHVQVLLPAPVDTIMVMLVPPILHLHSIMILDKGCCFCRCRCCTVTVKILEKRIVNTSLYTFNGRKDV
jgi:hypothetical protein